MMRRRCRIASPKRAGFLSAWAGNWKPSFVRPASHRKVIAAARRIGGKPLEPLVPIAHVSPMSQPSAAPRPDPARDESQEELERRIAATRPQTRSEQAAALARIHAAIDEETRLKETPQGPDSTLHRAGLAKWRLLADWVARNPYRDRQTASRSAHWRTALELMRPLHDTELIDWVALQGEITGNLEKGIPDMRPRKGGPTSLLVLEFAVKRARKAEALLQWAESAAREGSSTVDSAWHARTRAILGRGPDEFGRGAGGHEGVPWPDAEEN